MGARRMEQAFTLVEILLAASIGSLVLWLLVAFLNRSVTAGTSIATRMRGSTSAAALFERIESDAASSLAVAAPPSDLFGAPNADGHEIDLYGRDALRRPYRWAYTFDATAATVTRYALGGAAPLAGSVTSGVTSFTAVPARVSDLRNPTSPAYDPLFAPSNASDVAIPVDAGATGGNGLVLLHLTASGFDAHTILASPDAPTSFTVVVSATPSPAPTITPTPQPLVMTTP